MTELQSRMSAHCLSSARVHSGRARELTRRREEWARGPGLAEWQMWLGYVIAQSRRDLEMLQLHCAEQLSSGDRLEIAEMQRQLDLCEPTPSASHHPSSLIVA